jgi:hypothetical protein
MALNNYQFKFSTFYFGGAGSPFQILDVDGLEALPDLSTQDDNRGYNDGMFSGRDFLRGRTITMNLLVMAGNGNSAFQNFDLFQQALNVQQSGTTAMNFQLSTSDTEKVINVRVRGRRATIDPEYTFGYIKAQITLFAPDPRYYSATVTTGTMNPQAAPGRTYNRTYNLVYGGGSLTNSLAVVNSGWATTYPTITITGPVTNPQVGNITTGQYLTVNTNLTNTDSLVIDLYNKLVTLNGNSARNLLAGNSQWFGAPPGTTNFYFTGTNTLVGTTTATVVYQSAYI